MNALILAGALLACGDKNTDDTGTASNDSDLVYSDTNNYSYNADLQVDTELVRYGGDVNVDWSALTQDFRGRPLDPAQVGWATLIAFSITKEDVLASINDNSLSQSNIRDYRLFENDAGASSAHLSDFAILGNEFTPNMDFVEGEGTWTWAVTLWQENDGRDEILVTVFLDPDKASTNLDAAITDATGSLDFTVDLHSAPALSGTEGSYTFDWSAATVEASGQDFDNANGDRLLLGHIVDGTVTSVEADFLTILEDADEIYRKDTFGLTSVTLGDATERTSGATFPGFQDATGVWLIGIECTTCTSPAPLILSVVELSPAYQAPD